MRDYAGLLLGQIAQSILFIISDLWQTTQCREVRLFSKAYAILYKPVFYQVSQYHMPIVAHGNPMSAKCPPNVAQMSGELKPDCL